MSKKRKGSSGCNQPNPKTSKNTLNPTVYATQGKVAVDIPEILVLVPVDSPWNMSDFSNLAMAAAWRWV
ncbi:hypothetical protein [Candidatus Thiodiazotropha endoloripes]|uniref:Uncharacterized protein n=1 Tax=Candidatus Thiodiazotropha endoloripes TaxID=1818881 RepID=A0A1E2UTG3_9GAMM|nr:hypothetical protein [Candidatus Thiodiazotropha endoloripes]MCG7983780.1 hypothetical protein [Candidatus Thiodiazotropha lotti]ODB98036.1 hypothetical protein A3196_15480 [Candidatus Thiodiazotropha endoloripes]